MPVQLRLKFAKLILLAGTFLLSLHSIAHAQQNAAGDSITIAIAPEYNKVSNTHRFFLGDNHRRLWATPVKIKIFHIAKEKGGLKILQLGGGKQTKSLRLADPTGQEWVLRTIQKFPENGLPANLRKTVTKDILQDQVSAAHPFSALTVPPLAQALDIPHSNPQIVYVPDDAALGEYREKFANQVFLFEEREPIDAEKTYNTVKAQEKLKEDNDNHVDQKLVLRARLLDMLLGDWDRHEDQWRWEKIDEKKGANLYKPVPRDRDQVYYKTSGLFPWIVSHQWLNSKFQGYDYEIRDVKGWNVQARYFDRYFLNSLSEDDWKKEIGYVQNTLTDELITTAVKRMPDSIYEISGKEIVAKMISRRNLLMKQAMEYYRFIAIYVDVPATDKRDNFAIVNKDDGTLEVSINKIKKDGTLDQVTYHRIFDPAVTREVRLYGFAGKDDFNVSGTKPSPVKLRIIGGDDEDSVTVNKELHNKGNIYVYDRSDQPNVVPTSSQAKLRLSKDTTVNSYDKQSFKYDRFMPITLANYSIDNGILLIGGFSYEKHGFRKEPYAFKHELLANYSIGRKSFIFTYTADYKGIFGKNNLLVSLRSLGPNNLSNFFGIGNESVFVNEGDKEISYYRNRYDLITGNVSIYRDYNNWRFSAGAAGQFYTSEEADNPKRFLLDYNQLHPDEKVFDDKLYAGFVTSALYDSRNKPLMATQGIYWSTTISGYKGVKHADNKYMRIASEFGVAYNPDKDSILIISNRTGAATTIGHAEFFQKVKLGGVQNLRGFHTGRFTGETMAYNDLEMRVKVLDFNSYLLPGSIGLIGFNDIGRVWTPGESSNAIHVGYGGGLYVIPAKLVLIEAVFGFSKEGSLPYISFGVNF
ncbi:hypothetical protein GCM10023149_00410 [Mucilaginibacter gynuensis]|uniref:Bacterial surface antigen (D15) domain-containing protein n=1 Tax=Mucilaginibacter gynuensis TaxID=1302236 RepID=A0ABP8FME4_9SPHI